MLSLRSSWSVLVVAFLLGGVLVLSEAGAARVEEEEEVEECRCSARLKFSRPSLMWSGGELVFKPTVDVKIRSRGDGRQPWTAQLAYEGSSSYESEDVFVPAGVSFSGEQEVFSGQCGDRFSYKGMQLNQEVTLAGLPRDLENREEIEGRVEMAGVLSGCDIDEEHRAFKFDLKELGDLRVKGWRRVR